MQFDYKKPWPSIAWPAPTWNTRLHGNYTRIIAHYQCTHMTWILATWHIKAFTLRYLVRHTGLRRLRFLRKSAWQDKATMCSDPFTLSNQWPRRTRSTDTYSEHYHMKIISPYSPPTKRTTVLWAIIWICPKKWKDQAASPARQGKH